MPKSTIALIKGSVLRWARETAGMTPAQAAEGLAIDPDRYLTWEDDAVDGAPSIPQLRRLAVLYRRPLAAFYLPEPPTGFLVMRDLRRLPGTGLRVLPSSVQLEVRAAMQRRELTLELAQDLEEPIALFNAGAALNENPEDVAGRLRAFLGVATAEQQRWSDAEGRAAYRAWRDRLESRGVLVFQTTSFPSEVASGFAVWHEQLPIIGVNQKDTLTRRSFSLLHEAAHLMLRVSGVSDADADAARPPEDQAVEVFCNAVAAATLMPAADVLAIPEVAAAPARSIAWTDATIAALARVFGASREALVRRLLALGKTTEPFYREKRAQYFAERARRRDEQREENKARENGIPRNVPRETLGNLGRPFVRLVLGNYHRERLTLSEVSGYLGVKTKHIPKLEHDLGLS